LRILVDAILVGAETVRKDNPKLTVRHPLTPKEKPPLSRIVLTRSGNLPEESHLFTDELASHTKVFQNIAWPELLLQLGELGITSVLIEGGGQVLGQALDAQVIQEMCLYVAPRLCGGPTLGMPTTATIPLTNPSYEQFGDDIRITGFPNYSTA